jgi:molybdopterin converting factor small subunit
MAVEIYIPPVLQALVNGTNRVYVNGATIGECLKETVRKYPALVPKLYGKKGNLLKGVNIFLNGESANPKPLSKPVRDGDKIHIFHIVLGG